jgi:ABC-type sugar transport system ATPase subunit
VTVVAPGDGVFEAMVEVVEPLGHVTIVHMRSADDARIVAVMSDGPIPRPGDRVGLRFALDRLHVFASDGRRLAP